MTKTNPVLERAQRHFQGQETKVIEVPEWGEPDKPLVIYAPPLTLRDKRIVAKIAELDVGAMADLLIEKARDKDGNRIFSKMDKMQIIDQVDPDIVSRIVGDMMRSDSVEDKLEGFELTRSGDS